ncbi:MAG: UDP-3-O-[3-hydroxymyristoyl] N-acetylglucosamine deacetylase [Bdellovibrionales bacterium GWB1_55_8]|nr:MAG: UDP-3-O-[3-hydroxymyristoyl] N-acetylglucosamine deacetylase [Bdellovibrionales bacterium GWB1_55_8]
MEFQQTLRQSVSLIGIGLHSGAEVSVTIRPARPNQGICFVRVDMEGAPHVSAHYKNVTHTQLATTLGRGRITVATVEHLLAALHGLRIDNATIEVNGSELPILDGSAAPYVEAIQIVGIETQRQIRPYLALRKRIEIRSGDKWAVAEPSSGFEVHGSIEWNHPAIGKQEFCYREDETQFAEIADARTFGFLRDVEMMRQMGLARGGSLENAIVLDDSGVLNPEGLRYSDEFARHKVLDALGDFKLAGIEIQAFFRLHKAGHDLHGQLLSAIFKDPDNYEIIEGIEEDRRPSRVRTALASGFVAGIR